MSSTRPVAFGTETQFYPSKTPGRAKARLENAIHPVTVHGKGKDVTSKTPFHPATLHPKKQFKDPSAGEVQLKPTITTRGPAKPLGDKTPFPNRTGNGAPQFQTPLPQLSKFPGLAFLEPDALLQFNKTPDALLRPSSTRKHTRAPRSASKSFETPLNGGGNHWDISEISVVIPEAEIQEPVIEDDFDEVEYMPPNNLDLPYQPPFDFELPDYKQMGKTLRNLAQSYPYEDSPAPEITIHEDDIELVSWDMFVLPELEDDDPFKPATKPLQPSSAAPIAGKQSTSRVPYKATSAPQKPVSTGTTGVLHRNPSINKNATNRISRLGTTSTLATSSVTSVSRPIVKTTGLNTMSITDSRPKSVATRQAIGGPAPPKKNQTQNSVTTKYPINTVLSRPATSTSTTRRTVVNSTNTVPIRRPTTSASMYKPSTTKLAPRKAADKPISVNTKKATSQEDVGIIIQGGLDLDDDFRFNV